MSLVSNIVIILYLLFLVDVFGIFGLAVTFLIGWTTQILVQLPALKKMGFIFRPALGLKNAEIREGLKEIGRLMLPVMVGAWLLPVNLLVNTAIAGSVLGVAAIRYANSIYVVMTGVLVLSVTNVMFTRFSKLTAANKDAELRQTVLKTSGVVTLLILPLSILLFFFSPLLIRIIFERGAFTAESTLITGNALRFFSLGMAGFGLFHILSRAFYAKKDGKTPLFASLAAMTVNVVLSLLLVGPMGTGGIALSSSVSVTTAGVILLIVFLLRSSASKPQRKGGRAS
jgi:putative peptidoglycan lipid II flippase